MCYVFHIMCSQIIPAILTNDIQDAKQKIAQLNDLVEWVQIDVMDNIFVPNTSIQISDLRGVVTNSKLEAHLMIKNPQEVFDDCAQLEFKRVIFHFEAVNNVSEILTTMNKFDFEKGIAINPDTDIQKIIPFLDKLDVVLFMSVYPGFQNQKFIPKVLEKIKELKKISPNTKIAIDGGVKKENIKSIANAGVDDIDVGSAMFINNDPETNLEELNNLI